MNEEAKNPNHVFDINNFREGKAQAQGQQLAKDVENALQAYYRKGDVYKSQFMNKLNDEIYGTMEAKAPFKDGSEVSMDEGTKIILERLERDAREREQRYHADAQEREQRVRDRDEQFRKEIKERDDKFREESREREERIVRLVEETKRDLKEDFFELKSDFKEMRSDFKDLKNSTNDTNKWIIGLAITTIIAIVAIAVAVWVSP